MVVIIEEVIALRGKIKVDGLQEALEAFIDSQVLVPGRWQPVAPEQLKPRTLKSRLLITIQENLEEYKESIRISWHLGSELIRTRPTNHITSAVTLPPAPSRKRLLLPDKQ